MSIKQCCGLGRCVVTKGLQDCSGCKAISYCGREHQVEHYKDGHKLVCPGREKPLSFASCVEKATRYYNGKMWVAALPYYSALLVRSHKKSFSNGYSTNFLTHLPCFYSLPGADRERLRYVLEDSYVLLPHEFLK